MSDDFCVATFGCSREAHLEKTVTNMQNYLRVQIREREAARARMTSEEDLILSFICDEATFCDDPARYESCEIDAAPSAYFEGAMEGLAYPGCVGLKFTCLYKALTILRALEGYGHHHFSRACLVDAYRSYISHVNDLVAEMRLPLVHGYDRSWLKEICDLIESGIGASHSTIDSWRRAIAE